MRTHARVKTAANGNGEWHVNIGGHACTWSAFAQSTDKINTEAMFARPRFRMMNLREFTRAPVKLSRGDEGEGEGSEGGGWGGTHKCKQDLN